MNVESFVKKTKAPEAFSHQLIALNPDDDFTRFCEDPEDWHVLSPTERMLHGVKLLNNAWRYWKKRLPPESFRGVARDDVLESVFSTVKRVCSSDFDSSKAWLVGVQNPAAYLFTSVKNATFKEIESHRPPFRVGNIDALLIGGKPSRRNGEAVWTATIDFGPIDYWESVQKEYLKLEACCDNPTERAIIYERWRKPSQGWLSPEWASVIASQLDLPLEYILATLQSVQSRYVESVNRQKRQQHKRQISPVPITHVSPDRPTPALSRRSTTAA